MQGKRVAITGIGVVAPNAIGKEKFWEALAMGRSGIGRITKFDPSEFGIETQIAGEVQDFDPSEHMSKKDIRRASIATQFAVASAKMAMSDAKLQIENKKRFGAIIGVSSSASDIIEVYHSVFRRKDRINPVGLLAILPSAPTNSVAVALNCQGMVLTISNTCVAGTDAIGYAFSEIASGGNDVIVTGGAESQLSPFGLAMISAAGVVCRSASPERASRPFDKTRDGMVISEGAGILIFEEFEHAIKRGAYIYAEILGHASRSDGVENIEPGMLDTGVERSMRLALLDAGVSPNDVGYICAHATGDSFDAVEVEAIKRIFGRRAREIPISSIKSMIGNPLSAAGPLQLIASLMVLERGIVPPTINLEHPIDCDLDFVPNKARKVEGINTILINSHGLGGSNSSLVIGKYRG